MFVACKLTLRDLNILRIEVGDDGERGGKPALAEFAVADQTNHRLPAHAIANRATGTTAFMHIIH